MSEIDEEIVGSNFWVVVTLEHKRLHVDRITNVVTYITICRTIYIVANNRNTGSAIQF